jgi:DinB family protein
MPPQTPYSIDLGEREPIRAMRESTSRITAVAATWSPAQFERSYAPGKWSARQIFTHLAQSELAFGNRVRMALATPGYVAQSFDQDAWMARETSLSGRAAVDALLATNAMNCALFDALSIADRSTAFSHPEYGALTVDWVIHQMAGHLIHHLEQLEVIAKRA